MKNKVTCKTLDDTRQLALRFAKVLKSEDIILFTGDLGAGKTFFISELCGCLGIDPFQVTSPSFNIVKSYSAHKRDLKVHHFDLYRMDNEAAVDFFEFEDYLDEEKNIIFIEWADRLPNNMFPGRVISVTISITGITEREFVFKPWIFSE